MLTWLELADNDLHVAGSRLLSEAVLLLRHTAASGSCSGSALRYLGLRNNGCCGLWADRSGLHGRFDDR